MIMKYSSLKCVAMNIQEWGVRPVTVNINSNGPLLYL